MINNPYANKVSCPYCGSTQVKSMPRQPSKYPKPTNVEDILNWQNGYDCKKCGSEFTVAPKETSKSGGFFKKLLKWSVILIIAFVTLIYLIGSNKPEEKEAPNIKINKIP